MTRLTSGDLSGLAGSLEVYDQQLTKVTGHSLCQLSCAAIGVTESALTKAAETTRVAAIPVTAGQGIISGFSLTVKAVAEHIGFPAFTTAATDAAGMREALTSGAGIIIMADDNSYFALNLTTKFVAENSASTAAGFITALRLMSKELKGRSVLVIGCGDVGANAARLLALDGAKIGLYDLDEQRSKDLAVKIAEMKAAAVQHERNLTDAISKYSLIVEASPGADFIGAEHVRENMFVVAPGVPQGVTTEARALLNTRYLHDPIQLGTAVMLTAAVLSRSTI